MNEVNKSEMHELEEMKRVVQSHRVDNTLETPYFSKKVMRTILTRREDTQLGFLRPIHVKIVLFLCLVLFPALTEAI